MLVDRQRIIQVIIINRYIDFSILFNQLPNKPNPDDIKKLRLHHKPYTKQDIIDSMNNKGTGSSSSNSPKIPIQQLMTFIARRWRYLCKEDERQLFHDYSNELKVKYNQRQ